MSHRISFLLIIVLSAAGLFAQSPKAEILTKGNGVSIRGLSVVDNQVVWVSGSKGTVGRSTDGGTNWKWTVVTGFEKTEFRDIEAFDAHTAVIMAVGEPAYILRTTNGGESWKIVFENKTKGMFLDAMEFWNEKSGIVIGDPVDGHFYIARTVDGGNNWYEIPLQNRPVADSGEACFAASGTNIRALNKDEAVFVSGGLKSSLFYRSKKITLPLLQGKETTGANSIAVWDNQKREGGRTIIVTGGDFLTPDSASANCYLSNNRGKTWKKPETSPHGYRSCVEFLSRKQIFSCGLNGIDYTEDGGMNWSLISKDGFHVCRKAKEGNAVFFAGNNGKIAKIVWE